MPGDSGYRPESVGLPIRPFLYTLDQIAGLIQHDLLKVKAMVFYEGRTIVLKQNFHLVAINIANPDDTPEWRVSEHELIRWMKYKGFHIYETRRARTRPIKSQNPNDYSR